MQKFVKFPFLFFLIAASIGLLFRWHFINPLSWLKFPYWLHAHSHLMFLGWIFNLFNLAFIQEHIPESSRKRYFTLFLIIQTLLLGMLISFPLQGYGLYSIIFSTLHTLLVGLFAFWFFRDTKQKVYNPSLWFARTALILFLISSVGPFSLGPLVVNGLAHTQWYYFIVYYFLHFQYNGAFAFGVFSLFFGFIQKQEVPINQKLVKRLSYLLLISCFPTYFLSVLWAQPGLIFNLVGLTGAIIQLVALFYLVRIVISIPKSVVSRLSTAAKMLLLAAFGSLIIKFSLQLISAHPEIAQLAYEVRNYVMAYLHLVLLGMISSFLLAWSIEMKWIANPGKVVIWLFLTGFVGMELILISTKFWIDFAVNPAMLLFIFSALIVLAVAGFLKASLYSHSIKN